MTVKTMKSRLMLASLAGVTAVAAGVAGADTGTVNATIDVIKPTSIRAGAGSVLDFGQLVAPTDQNAVWTLTPISPSASNLSGNSSDSMDLVAGDHEAGMFYVSAEPGYTVNISTEVTTDFSAAGLSLAIVPALHVLGNGSIPFPAVEPYPGFEMPVVVGGELTINVGSAWGENAGGDPAVVEVTAHY